MSEIVNALRSILGKDAVLGPEQIAERATSYWDSRPMRGAALVRPRLPRKSAPSSSTAIFTAFRSSPRAEAFRAARDLLLRNRTDYESAYRTFRWPEFTHFNWALDHLPIEDAATMFARVILRPVLEARPGSPVRGRDRRQQADVTTCGYR